MNDINEVIQNEVQPSRSTKKKEVMNKQCQNNSKTLPFETKKTQENENFITKTYLYNFDPLKLHFYIVKLGFTGVYITFLISAQKHRMWILVRTVSTRRF